MNTNDIQGLGLNLLNRFARSDWPDRLKVRKSVEKLLFVGSRTGFQLVGAAARSFSPAGGAGE